MKKIMLVFVIMCMVLASFLASCSEDSFDNSSISESQQTSSDSMSEKTESTEKDPSSRDDIKVLYNRFSEKPYFAMVGKCAEGAVVTADCNGKTISSNSYKGWFSLRLRCDGTSVEVKLIQKVNGEQIGEELVVNARPTTPGAEMWPVVTGGDFQFFFQKMLPDYLGQNIPSASVYDSMSDRVAKRVAQLRKYNPDGDVIYLIVPSSMSVYPELVPSDYGKPADQTRLDLAIDAINDGGGVAIDLKSLFAEHKEDEMTMYYKLDSHWSDYGAYLAYVALFDHISKTFPEAKPRPIDDFDWNAGYYDSGDMTYYLSMSQKTVKEYAYYRSFDAEVPAIVTETPRYRSSKMLCYSDAVTAENIIRTNREELPSAIVLRDSYSTQMYDILAERMNKTHYFGMWNLSWNNAAVESEKPDYVIYILAEWNLDSILYN